MNASHCLHKAIAPRRCMGLFKIGMSLVSPTWNNCSRIRDGSMQICRSGMFLAWPTCGGCSMVRDPSINSFVRRHGSNQSAILRQLQVYLHIPTAQYQRMRVVCAHLILFFNPIYPNFCVIMLRASSVTPHYHFRELSCSFPYVREHDWFNVFLHRSCRI